MDELDDGDGYEHVKHLTDLYRLHLFDVVMQYRAVFFDSAPAAGTAQVRARTTTLVGLLAARHTRAEAPWA